jgi:hypothetical protein
VDFPVHLLVGSHHREFSFPSLLTSSHSQPDMVDQNRLGGWKLLFVNL